MIWIRHMKQEFHEYLSTLFSSFQQPVSYLRAGVLDGLTKPPPPEHQPAGGGNPGHPGRGDPGFAWDIPGASGEFQDEAVLEIGVRLLCGFL